MAMAARKAQAEVMDALAMAAEDACCPVCYYAYIAPFLDKTSCISLYSIAQDCKCDNLPPREQEDIPKARAQAMIMLLTDLITKLQTSDVVSE